MLTLLITGADQETRCKVALDHQPNSPYLLDGREEGISIESVREFQRSLSFSNTDTKTQHAFILEAQNLSNPAQQALLKTLEEPPKDTLIILTTTKTSDLLPTIVSRCQVKQLETNSRNLDIIASTDAKALLTKINSQSHAQLVGLAEELVKDQQKLRDLLVLLKQSLHTAPSPKRAKAIKIVQTGISDLKANVQAQLCLEQMLFDLKALTK